MNPQRQALYDFWRREYRYAHNLHQLRTGIYLLLLAGFGLWLLIQSTGGLR